MWNYSKRKEGIIINWFKHDSNASTDAKLKKLVLRYGTDGYAIYFHCMELITSNVSETNITFELDHDCEIIADNLKVKGNQEQSSIDRVNEIMRYIVSLNLFEETEGRITCLKLLKRLDSSMTSNVRMRSLISTAKKHHDGDMIKPDDDMQDKNRKDKNRKEDIKHKYGEFKHVLLSDKDLEQLKASVDDVCKWIKTLDNYIETTGKPYKNHWVTMRNWYNNEKEKKNTNTTKHIVKSKSCTKCNSPLTTDNTSGLCWKCEG